MERESRIIKKLNHFHCKSNVPHEILVWTCPSHPQTYAITNAPNNCFCKSCSPYEICSNCVKNVII